MNIFPSSGGIACASCGAATGTAPIPSRFCAGSNHCICDPCFTTSLEENPFLPPACPAREEEDGSRICGRMIVDVNQISVPVYIDIYMSQFKFPCSFANYGCPFVGRGAEVLKHFAGGCEFSCLSVCKVKPKNSKEEECRLLFVDSPLRKIEHMKGVHGIHFGQVEKHAVEIVLSKDDGGLMEGNWRPIIIRILDYPGDRFCMMFVYENKEEVRMWLCELDPGKMGVEPGARFEVTISGISKAQGNQYFGYQSRVIPCMLQGLLAERDKYWRNCFNIEKKFLGQIAGKGDDGKMRFKMKIKFDLKEVSSSSESD